MALDRNYWAGNRMSRRGVMRAGGVTGLGLAGAALIGCGDDDEAGTPAPGTPTGTPEPDATPIAENGNGDDEDRYGGTLHRVTPGVGENFNQVANWQDANGVHGTHVYDRPLTNRADERIYVLEAAESYEVVSDTEIVMTLKPDMVYQDKDPVNGRPVEAEDIGALWEYVRQEERAHNPFFIRNVVDTWETPDDHTIRFTLQEPFAYTFTSAGLGYSGNNALIPRELLDDLDTNEPIGSGPYQLTDYIMGTNWTFERNPTYREAPLPYIDRRTVTDITDASAQEAAFRGEQLHTFRAFTAETSQRLINDLGDHIMVEEFPSFSDFTWGPSSERSDFDDERVREGLWRAFDDQQFIEVVAGGHALPVPGMLAAGLELYQLDPSESEEYKRHDPEEGRALLEAAGFDFDKTYEMSSITGANNETGLQVLEQQLSQVGISNFTYNVLPGAEWIANVTPTGAFDFTVIGHPAEDTPHRPMRLNHTDTGLYHQGFNVADPEIDEIITASEQEIDFEAHVELVKEAQRRLMQVYAHKAYVFTSLTFDLTWNYVKDWELNTGTHVMYQTQAWLDL